MQTPSPTTKPLAGMPASAAAAERVFSAQPVVQETDSAGTDLKDEAYGGLLLKVTPPKKSVRSPGLLDNATLGQHALVGGVKERNVSQSGQTGSVSASSSGPRYGQWPGIRRPGTVWPVNPALFDT